MKIHRPDEFVFMQIRKASLQQPTHFGGGSPFPSAKNKPGKPKIFRISTRKGPKF